MLLEKRLSTVDARNLQAILSTHSQNFSIGEKRRNVFRMLLGNGLFAAEGIHWEKSRAALKPGLARNQTMTRDYYVRHTRGLIDRIPRNGEEVDLQVLFFDMVMGAAMEMLFGPIGKTYGGTALTRFCEDYDTTQEGGLRFLKLGAIAHLNLRFKLRFARARTCCRQYVGDIVGEAIRLCESDTKPDRLPDCLLSSLAEKTSDETELTDQMLTILLGGGDITAALLGTQFHILARHPDIWVKLRAEVSGLDGESPSLSQVKQMKYVFWVINETLRLYPPVARNERVAVRDTVLPVGGGVDGKASTLVPKGQGITLDFYSLHRDKTSFGADADEFRPERWGERLQCEWTYLPFGGGPRVCIGQHVGIMQAAYTTIRLVQTFARVEPRDSHPWEELLKITCTSRHGTRVAMFESCL